MVFSRTGEGKHEISLEHYFVSETKEASKNDGAMSKGPRSQLQEVPTDQIWDNLG